MLFFPLFTLFFINFCLVYYFFLIPKKLNKIYRLGQNPTAEFCCIFERRSRLLLLLLFYRAASEGWQPPMSKEDIRESPLAQKCYWHRTIPEVGGNFDPSTKQGTSTTRRRPPLVGLIRVQPDAQTELKQHRKKASHYY